MRLFLAPGLVLGALVFSTASAQAQARYKNLVNTPFATISSGPQSSVSLDVPVGATPQQMSAAVETRLRREWQARSKALAPALAQQKRKGAYPLSTLVTLHQGGRAVAPRVTRAFGNGQLTFTFENFNGASVASNSGSAVVVEDFLKSFINEVYPRLVALYGKPAFSGEVKIRSMGFFNTGTATDVERLAFGAYSPSENRIYLPLYQSIDSLAHACLLNLIHAFHGPLALQYDAWEQGFARAAATIIARDPALGFGDPTANNLYTLLPYYDLLNQPALGNSTFFPPSQANLLIDGEITVAKMLQARMGMSGAAWLKCYIEDKSFFVNFNAAYYAQADTLGASLAGNVPQLKSLAASVLPSVEGLPFLQWFQQQYVLDTSVTTGPKLYAFVLPSQPSAANGDQSSLIALVHYRTKPSGDEELLSGRAYATYFNPDNARVILGSGSEQTQIEQGEGFLTTLAFPNQGFDDGRLVADFSINGLTTRTYLPQGITGDLQAVLTGGIEGTVTAKQTTILAPITNRQGTATVTRRGFGVSLGSQFGELEKTSIEIVSGPTIQTFKRNTGDGLNYLILRPINAGGGVTTVSQNFPVATLGLVSFPVQPLESTVEAAFGRSASDFLLASWDPLGKTYAAVAPSTPSFGLLEPGRGYFLKFMPTPGGPLVTTLSVTGVAPATDVDYTIHLAYGWNLIGTPFSQTLDLTKTLVKYLENDAISFTAATGQDTNNAPLGTLVADKVWGLDTSNGSYFATNAIDSAWRGYWLRVYAPQGVSLIVPGPDTPGRAVKTRALVPLASAKPDWALTLRATQGTRQSQLQLGAAPGATRAFDPRWDAEAPPSVAPGLSLAVESDAATAGGRIVSDFRSPAEASKTTWNLTLTGAQTGNTTVVWEGLASVPKSVRLTLIDLQSGARTALRQRSGLTLPLQAGQTRKFQLVTEPELSQPLAITHLQTAGTGRAGGGIRLQFQLTADAELFTEVTTFAGRSVRRFPASRGRATETQSLLWNGLSDSGQPLPAGPYRVTITARTDDGQTTQATRPLQLLR